MSMATLKEDAEIEGILSTARVEYLQRWRAELRRMRTQIDDLLKEIEDVEYALA